MQNATLFEALFCRALIQARCKVHHFSQKFLYRVFGCYIRVLGAVFCTDGTCVMSVPFKGGEMFTIGGSEKLSRGAKVDDEVDRHQQIAKAWIASAIEGSREMHQDELVRRRVAAKLTKTGLQKDVDEKGST